MRARLTLVVRMSGEQCDGCNKSVLLESMNGLYFLLLIDCTNVYGMLVFPTHLLPPAHIDLHLAKLM